MDDKMINAVKNGFVSIMPAINFYTKVVEDGMMLATTADIKGAEENTPEIGFDMFFPIAEFAETITDEEHVQKLVNRVLEQYKEVI